MDGSERPTDHWPFSDAPARAATASVPTLVEQVAQLLTEAAAEHDRSGEHGLAEDFRRRAAEVRGSVARADGTGA